VYSASRELTRVKRAYRQALTDYRFTLVRKSDLHLSELSDQLDVTLESSKIVKLALTWVATTQSDAIK